MSRRRLRPIGTPAVIRAPSVRCQMEEASSDFAEAARVDVERFQVRGEADVEELAPGPAGTIPRRSDNTHADAVMPRVGRHHHVFEKGVHQPVPENVGKADQEVPSPGRDPAQAVSLTQIDPIPFRLVVETSLECFGVKGVDLLVREDAAPRIDRVIVPPHLCHRPQTQEIPTPGSGQIESVEVHDLDPRRDEVVHEHLLRISASVDL
jgi:hypothetical protein